MPVTTNLSSSAQCSLYQSVTVIELVNAMTFALCQLVLDYNYVVTSRSYYDATKARPSIDF